MRLVARAACLLALAAIPLARAGAADAPDYSKPTAWVCRPGQEGPCTSGLDSMMVQADGRRTAQAFAPDADAPIDCFYVYPTVSHESTPYADMQASPEVVAVVHDQAGRLTSQCRLYAPIYRQLTEAGLRQVLGQGGLPDWSAPYADVLAAWRWYLAHDNHGRGVVLVGHSQGTILLQKLIAGEIDNSQARGVLVSVFLAGDPGLAVPKGAAVGGVFHHIPLCGAAAQTGCAYAWGSYMADDNSSPRLFGENPSSGRDVAGCAIPAAPAGGSGALAAYFHRPAMAPQDDPPWVELVGQLSASCVADGEGDVARVSIEPGLFADRLRTRLVARRPGWGMHVLDIGLEQGNIVEVVAAERAAWVKAHAAH